jgi:hypothetical protein
MKTNDAKQKFCPFRSSTSAESKLQEIDNEIRVASPTMSGEHNYRITLDGAKRIKKAIQDCMAWDGDEVEGLCSLVQPTINAYVKEAT